jgi:hypothetical protein
MTRKFWMVYLDDRENPSSAKFFTIKSARERADEIARINPGVLVYILEAKGCIRYPMHTHLTISEA